MDFAKQRHTARNAAECADQSSIDVSIRIAHNRGCSAGVRKGWRQAAIARIRPCATNNRPLGVSVSVFAKRVDMWAVDGASHRAR